jgi:hypothetical protein
MNFFSFFLTVIIYKSIEEIIREFQFNITTNFGKGVAVEDGNPPWGFSGSFLFSLTVITTIGKCSALSQDVKALYRLDNCSV